MCFRQHEIKRQVGKCGRRKESAREVKGCLNPLTQSLSPYELRAPVIRFDDEHTLLHQTEQTQPLSGARTWMTLLYA